MIDDNEGNIGNVYIPKDNSLDICYICAIHMERNAINTSRFNNYINVTHTNDGGNIDLKIVPKNTVIIESAIIDKRN